MHRQLQSEDPQGEFGVPTDILDAWKQAVQSKSRNAKNALFNAFLKAGKNWGQLLGPKCCSITICMIQYCHNLFFMRLYFYILFLTSPSPLIPSYLVAIPHPRLRIQHSRSRAERTTGQSQYGENLSRQRDSLNPMMCKL